MGAEKQNDELGGLTPFVSASVPVKANATTFDSLWASIPMYTFFMACPLV